MKIYIISLMIGILFTACYPGTNLSQRVFIGTPTPYFNLTPTTTPTPTPTPTPSSQAAWAFQPSSLPTCPLKQKNIGKCYKLLQVSVIIDKSFTFYFRENPREFIKIETKINSVEERSGKIENVQIL